MRVRESGFLFEGLEYVLLRLLVLIQGTLAVSVPLNKAPEASSPLRLGLFKQ